MAMSRGDTVETATAYADKVVVQTHVDYTAENAPRWMNPNALGGLGRLAFQFRRYQQAMVFLWVKTLTDAVRHGGLKNNEHARALVYLTGANLAVAGTAGLPIAAPLGLALSMVQWGEDDEKRDWLELVRAGMRDVVGDRATTLITKGIPASIGVDMSKRLGAGDILSPVYRMPSGSTGQEVMGGWAMQLFGASGGMAANWMDAAKVAGANPVMAVEKLLPAGAKNLVEAVNREQNGLVDRRGNQVVPADEFGLGDFLLKGLNLGESTAVTDMYDMRSAIGNAAKARDDARKRLLHDATKARLAGDSDAAVAVREKIAAFNERNRETPIKPKNVLAAYQQEVQRRRELVGGVRVTQRNADIAKQYGLTD
jgi:hypothetical protein